MSDAKYISLNGKILPANQACIMHNNRIFNSGDGFSIKCRGTSSKIFFFDKIYQYIEKQLINNNYKLNKLFRKNIFKTDIELLLQKSRIYQGFSLNIVFFRESLESNNVNFLISAKRLDSQHYTLNENNLFLDEYTEISFPSTLYSKQFLSIFQPENLIKSTLNFSTYDDYILIDEFGLPFKTINSHILFIKDNKIISLKNAPDNYYNIIADEIISISKKYGLVHECKTVIEGDIRKMDEIILTNPYDGLLWVVGYKDYRYVCKKSEIIIKELNQRAKNSISESK